MVTPLTEFVKVSVSKAFPQPNFGLDIQGLYTSFDTLSAENCHLHI